MGELATPIDLGENELFCRLVSLPVREAVRGAQLWHAGG